MPTLAERKEKLLKFSGPVVATATPFGADGNLDLTGLPQYIAYLTRIGVKGVYLHGTTGEGLSMSLAEKKLLTLAWTNGIRDARADLLVVVTASATCMSETKELFELCATLPVDAMAVLPPFYYRPENVDGLVNYLSDVSFFAPNLPLIYYHFPAMTGVVFPLTEVLHRCQASVPALGGMKFTSPDIINLQRIQTKFGSTIKLFAGYEETLLPSFACGLDSAICALFHFEPIVKSYYDLVSSIKNDPGAARNAQRVISGFNLKFDEGSFLAKVKRALNEAADSKFSVGEPRPPIYPAY